LTSEKKKLFHNVIEYYSQIIYVKKVVCKTGVDKFTCEKIFRGNIVYEFHPLKFTQEIIPMYTIIRK